MGSRGFGVSFHSKKGLINHVWYNENSNDRDNVTGLAGGVAYVYKLKADNAILKENAIKLENAVSNQRHSLTNKKRF